MLPRRCTFLVLLVGTLTAAGATAADWGAHPEALLPEHWAEGFSWEVQPVNTPVSPEQVRGAAPFVPAGVQQVTGSVEVGPERGATFWLSALEVVRVTAEAGTLRFVRVPRTRAGEDSRLQLDEPGIPVQPGRWYLAEPMGGGSVWVVTASKPTRVRIERPTPREGALPDEAVRMALLRWVEGKRQQPPSFLPAELRTRLEVESQLALALARGVPEQSPLHAALLDWRKASALRAWSLHQPLHTSTFRITRPRPPGAPVALEGVARPFFQQPGSAGAWTLELTGPGVLALELRPLLRPDTERVVLEVLPEGQAPRRLEVRPRPALMGPEQALPVPSAEREHRKLASGETVGLEEELRVPLRPGRHTYRVQWKGGPVLLRARVAHRRPWLGEVLAGEVDWEDLAGRAWKRVEADRSPQATLLRRQLASLGTEGATAQEGAPSGSGLSLELRALVALEEAEAETRADARAARALAARDALLGEGLEAGSTWAWHLRLRLARLLLELGRTDETHRLLSAAPSFPESGWQAAEAAEVVARLPQGHPLRSRQLAALELAWRREPLSEEIRRQYREAWWHASRWGLLHPAGTQKAVRPARRRWLDVQPLEEGAQAGTRALWPLRPGSTVRVRPTGAAESPSLLRAYVLPPTRARGPLVLHVGTSSFPLLPLSAVEPVEVALPPGEHLIRLEADEGTRAFLSLSPVGTEGTPEEVGYVHTQWPVRAGGEPVRFRIPEPHLPSPVRVMLRVTKAPEGPVAVWMRTDIGPPRRMVLESEQASSRHFALEGSVAAPPPVSVVLPLPTLTREVWFEPESPDVQLMASLSVRQSLDAASGDDEPPALPALDGPPLETLLTLSRRLSDTPGASELLLARAELLLALAEEPLAREDLTRVLGGPEGDLTTEQTRHLLALLERLEEAEAPERVRFSQAISRPMLLAPGFGALADAGNPEVHTLAALARESGASRALERLSDKKSPAERYLRARLLAETGQEERAARELVRLYQRTGQPQLGLEALAFLEKSRTVPQAWADGGALLGSVLANQLGAWVELPLVRRMRAETGRWTRWERLLDAEEKAGTLDAVQEGGPSEGAEVVRKALLAPPWPLDEARLLSAGGASVLALVTEGPRRLGVQGLCRPLHAGPKPPARPCAFALRVDGRTVAEAQAAAGEAVELTAPLRTSGRHQLEVVLDRAEVPVLGLVRFVTVPEEGGEARPLPAHQPLSMMRGRPGHPVVMTVRGPTAIRISARALAPQAGRYLLVRSTPLAEGAEDEDAPVRLGLPAEPDTTLQRQALPVGQEREAVLLLPERGAYRVRLEPTEGEALVRVQLAVAEPPAPSLSRDWPHAPTGPEPLPWPALPPPLSLLPETEPAARPASELGMLSLELDIRREDVDEGELERPLRTGLEARVGLRRELVPRRAWLRLEPQVRLPFDSTPVLGTRATLRLTGLPLELRASLRGALFAQRLEEALGWSARGWLSVDRRVQLTPDLALIPGLGLALESQRGREGVEADLFDRDVFWRYGERHPRRLTPELSLRWQPLLDHVGTLSAWATSNADLRTVDHASARARWSALLGGPWPYTRASLSYELSHRPEDAHRPRAYLRHGLRGQLDWSLWTSAQGRLRVFAEDHFLISAPFGPQNVFSLGLRWDWTGGRGLRDVLPDEEEFERLLDAGRSSEGAVNP